MSGQVTMHDTWGNLAVTISCKVIVHDGDKIWLRRNERETWELPGGRLGDGEQPEDAARREVLEELGLELGELQLVDCYVWKKDFGANSHVELVTFQASAVRAVRGQEMMGEAGLARFEQFTIEQALTLGDLPMPYKRALRKV